MSEKKDEQIKSQFDDVLADLEEDKDLLLQTQMKVYDVFMGNWKKLLYVAGGILLVTLVIGLYESHVTTKQQQFNSIIYKNTQSINSQNNQFAKIAALVDEYRALSDKVQLLQPKLQTDPTIQNEFIQAYTQFLAVQREFQEYDSLMANLDAVNPMAFILQPDFVSRAELYSNLELGKELSIGTPSLRAQDQIRGIASQLSKDVNILQGPAAFVGYLKLSMLWEKLDEVNAAQNALSKGLEVANGDFQEWTVRSRSASLYIQEKDNEKAIEMLKGFLTPSREGSFFSEYAHLSVALTYEAMGKTDEARNEIATIIPTRFVEEYAQLSKRLGS